MSQLGDVIHVAVFDLEIMRVVCLTWSDMPDRSLSFAFVFSLCLHALLLARFGVLNPADKVAGGGPLQVHIVTQSGDRQPSDEVQMADVSELRQLPQQFVQEIQVRKPTESIQSRALLSPPAKAVSRQQNAAVVDANLKQQASAQYPAIGVPSLGRAGGLHRVELDVELVFGSERRSVGMARYHYASESGDHYGVSIRPLLADGSIDEKLNWMLKIGGSITKDGLSPYGFEVKGVEGERLVSMREPTASQVDSADALRTGRIRDRVLDRLSLLYQFTLKPPQPDGGNLVLSDGKNYVQYSYRQEDGGVLSVVPLGEVRTIKLLITDIDGSEKIELWLIPDVHFLPVKMRHVRSTGEIAEQVVLSLKFQ